MCHRNLDCFPAHNYAKVFLLKVRVNTHKFEIGFYKTCLNSSVDVNNLEFSSHNVIRFDHPSSSK